MPEGITWQIITVSIIAWVISVSILSRFLSLKVSVIVASIKISIVFIYFGWFYDGSWTIKDDIKYHWKVQTLLQTEFNPLTLLATAEGREELLYATDRSRHVLYTWWVYTTQYLVGSVYYAPVFFNVVLTFIVGILLYQLCTFEGFAEEYSKGLLIVFLLHWDVLAWSSLISIKDSLVMTLTIGAFALGWPVLKHPQLSVRSALAILGVAVIVYALTFIRFYIPVLLGTATLLYLFLRIEGIQKYYFFLGGIAIVAAIILFNPLIQFHIDKDVVFDLKSIVFGVLRFPLTPKPWPLEPAYTFLIAPAILHWLFFIPAIVGGYSLWKGAELMKLLILFLASAILFYAVVEMLQNPRQRYQFSYIIVWMQYHFVVLSLNRIRRQTGIPIGA